MIHECAKTLHERFSSHPGLDIADIINELWIVYFKCKARYVSRRGRHTTYFYNAVFYESSRIFARAMGYGTYKKWKAHRDLIASAATDLDGVRARMPLTETPDPDANLTEAEAMFVADQILNDLPENMRVLLMARAAGRTWKEISQEYGVSPYWGSRNLRNAIDKELAKWYD